MPVISLCLWLFTHRRHCKWLIEIKLKLGLRNDIFLLRIPNTDQIKNLVEEAEELWSGKSDADKFKVHRLLQEANQEV